MRTAFERQRGAAVLAIVASGPRWFKIRSRAVACSLIVVLGSSALYLCRYSSAAFKGNRGLVNVAMNPGEISTAAAFTAGPFKGNRGLVNTTMNAGKGNRPLSGWKVISACRATLRVLIYVHTAPDHFDERRVHRDTIGAPRTAKYLNSSLVFFVGQTGDKNVRGRLDAEAATEGDVVQLDFLDTYRNLTLKFIGATKWLRSCGCLNKTEVVVKIDDDVMINVFGLESYLRRLSTGRSFSSPQIHCSIQWFNEPVRETHKWYVSVEEYPGDWYPPYCSGAGYLMRAPVLVLLGETAAHVPFFWVDDVYATGLVRLAANVGLVGAGYFVENVTEVNKDTIFLLLEENEFSTRGRLIWKSVMLQSSIAK